MPEKIAINWKASNAAFEVLIGQRHIPSRFYLKALDYVCSGYFLPAVRANFLIPDP